MSLSPMLLARVYLCLCAAALHLEHSVRISEITIELDTLQLGHSQTPFGVDVHGNSSPGA